MKTENTPTLQQFDVWICDKCGAFQEEGTIAYVDAHKLICHDCAAKAFIK